MDLYYHPFSAPCWSVLMLCRQMGLKPNLKLFNPSADEAEREAFRKVNPQRQIPTLAEGGDFAIGESRAILAYLVDAHGKSDRDQQLFPRDPKARAMVQFRLDYDLSMLSRRAFDYYAPMVYQKKPRTELSKAEHEKVHEALGFLETYLGRTRYAAGEQLTIADVALISSVSFLKLCDFEGLERHPKVEAWYETCSKELVGYEDVIGSKAEEYRQSIEERLKA